MSEKKLTATLKLLIPAGKATPAPPVGPAIGQKGIPIKAFCDKFNEMTKGMEASAISVKVYVFDDKSFDIEFHKTKGVSTLIKEHLKLQKGSSTPGKKSVAKLTETDLKEIAMKKQSDLTAKNLENAMKSIAGTAKSMGIEII